MRISVIVPVHNGELYLKRCLDELLQALSPLEDPWEIIVCENGSTDGTKHLAETLKEKYPSVRFVFADIPLGRGGALRQGVEQARGDVLAYVDQDMATDVSYLVDLINAAANESDIVTGSRYLPGSHARRTFSRFAMSKIYNTAVRAIFRSQLKDHQCGFKAFKRAVLVSVLPTVKANHWFWDTELLVRAQKMGLKVDEIPISWTEMSDGSTFRLGKDIRHFAWEMIVLWKDLHRQGRSA